MQPQNMHFILFFLDSRPVEELRASLDEVFGGRFEQDPKAKADGLRRYVNYVFGMSLSFRYEEAWQEGSVYRFAGSTDVRCRFDTIEELDIGFHARKILENGDLMRVMTSSEFREESVRRNPSDPRRMRS